MVAFPNCKINIGLRIIEKRPDGFHNLETIFYPVGWKDAVEIISNHENVQEVTWSQSGINIPGDELDNLCIKAYQLLKADFPEIPPVQMHLLKAIPMGAGLGGGSADAAFVLQLLNQQYNLNLSTRQLLDYALKLGSDCPFFIINKPCLATGRGEILEEIPLDLSAYKILLVNPGIHINTGWAFSKITPQKPATGLSALVTSPIHEWQQLIINDFEKPVMQAHPELASIKETLLTNGAVYAAMSGSGSSFYGIFHKESQAVFDFPARYLHKWV